MSANSDAVDMRGASIYLHLVSLGPSPVGVNALPECGPLDFFILLGLQLSFVVIKVRLLPLQQKQHPSKQLYGALHKLHLWPHHAGPCWELGHADGGLV